MNSNINNIIQHLFDKETLQDVPRDELVDFATRYPYAPIGRYLLAQKTYDEDPDIMHEGVQTTSLYINNPLWLQWLLSDHKTISGAEVKTAGTPDSSLDKGPVTNEPDPGPSATEEDQIVHTEENRQNGFETGSNHHSLHQENDESITDHQQQIAREQYVSTSWAPAIHTESIPTPENGQEQQDTTSQSFPEQGDQSRAETETGFVQETEETPPPESDSSAKDEVTVDERPIAFQSYHTIDYFASQGIRLQQAELAKDKLGQQLKSFTEWLRSMKKLPPPSTERMGDEEDSQQQNVAIIAGHSIEEKEVVTEAMAEVWAKQGRLEKARAVYHKLSLQNPHKSAYFAAKIDQLKV